MNITEKLFLTLSGMIGVRVTKENFRLKLKQLQIDGTYNQKMKSEILVELLMAFSELEEEVEKTKDEQFRFESRSLKITEDQYVQMMAQLYRGLYKEYGIDATPETEPVLQGSSKPAFDTALSRVFGGELPVVKTKVEPKTSLDGVKTTIKPNKPSAIIPDPVVNPVIDLKAKINAEIKKVSK